MVTRHLWFAAGAVCFVLGWIGMILPMMPGFVFLLAAVFCFARGNPALERWMLEHPQFGPPLNDWFERRAISRKAKRSALIAMAVAAALAAWMVSYPVVLFPLVSMAAVSAWIWTRAE